MVGDGRSRHRRRVNVRHKRRVSAERWVVLHAGKVLAQVVEKWEKSIVFLEPRNGLERAEKITLEKLLELQCEQAELERGGHVAVALFEQNQTRGHESGDFLKRYLDKVLVTEVGAELVQGDLALRIGRQSSPDSGTRGRKELVEQCQFFVGVDVVPRQLVVVACDELVLFLGLHGIVPDPEEHGFVADKLAAEVLGAAKHETKNEVGVVIFFQFVGVIHRPASQGKKFLEQRSDTGLRLAERSSTGHTRFDFDQDFEPVDGPGFELLQSDFFVWGNIVEG